MISLALEFVSSSYLIRLRLLEITLQGSKLLLSTLQVHCFSRSSLVLLFAFFQFLHRGIVLFVQAFVSLRSEGLNPKLGQPPCQISHDYASIDVHVKGFVVLESNCTY